ncbi:MAG: hypothetical protein JJ975_07845 [Bacteroidia bacterium]|nr:hypothetical protein [Bacteroidia bacterium]
MSYGQTTSSPKFGKGINFTSEDTSLTLKFHFRMQHLIVADYNSESEEWSSNALVRRSRLKFDGMALTPNLKYKVELGLTNRDMSVNKEAGQGRDAARVILDAVLKYKFAKNWQIWVGQTKLPGNRERVVSSANLQFVDRSNVNSKFNIDRDMGLQLRGKYHIGDVIIQPKFALTNGEGRNITEGNHGGLNYTGRVDILPFGAFEGKKQDYVLSDIKRQSKPKLAIGVTYNQNQNAVRQQGQLGSFVVDSLGDFVENTLTHFEADLIFKYQGFSLLTEYASTEGAKKLDDVSKNFITGSGINIQAGYLFKNNWELAGRYTSVTPDNVTYSGLKEQTEYTIGISKYIVGHSLKVQSDYGMIETAGSPKANYRLRLQVEMQF